MIRPDMQLPDGFTCADCISFQRCLAFGAAKAENRSCDWAPSRFYYDFVKARELKATINHLNNEVTDLKGYKEVLENIEARFGCTHVKNGSEDAQNIVRHIDELIEKAGAART